MTCSQVRESTLRRVRDLPLFEYRVVLHVPRRRLWSEHCSGLRLGKLDCLNKASSLLKARTAYTLSRMPAGREPSRH